MASNRVLLPLQGRPIIPISKIHTSINGRRGIAEIGIIRKDKIPINHGVEVYV
jgi:hypothetical protein